MKVVLTWFSKKSTFVTTKWQQVSQQFSSQWPNAIILSELHVEFLCDLLCAFQNESFITIITIENNHNWRRFTWASFRFEILKLSADSADIDDCHSNLSCEIFDKIVAEIWDFTALTLASISFCDTEPDFERSKFIRSILYYLKQWKKLVNCKVSIILQYLKSINWFFINLINAKVV